MARDCSYPFNPNRVNRLKNFNSKSNQEPAKSQATRKRPAKVQSLHADEGSDQESDHGDVDTEEDIDPQPPRKKAKN